MNKQTKDAAKMSKTALQKEVLKLRKDLKQARAEATQAKAEADRLQREIERRDRSSAKFREIEPRALYWVAALYPLWKAEGRPSFGMKGETWDIYTEATRYTGDFWDDVEISKIEYTFEKMADAKNHIAETARAKIEEATKAAKAKAEGIAKGDA